MNTIKLHFVNKTFIEPCIKALQEITNIPFEVQNSSPNMMDVLSKPEAIDVTAAVLLVFQSEKDCQCFIQNPKTKHVFLQFSSQEKEKNQPKPTDDDIDKIAFRSEN